MSVVKFMGANIFRDASSSNENGGIVDDLIVVYKKAKRTSLMNRILNIVIMSTQGIIAAGIAIYQLTVSNADSGVSKISSIILFAIPLLIGVVLQFKFDVQAASAYAASLRLDTVIKKVKSIRSQKGAVDETTETHLREFIEQINGQLYGYHYGVSNIADILEGMPTIDLIAQDVAVPPLGISSSNNAPVTQSTSTGQLHTITNNMSHSDSIKDNHISLQVLPASPKMVRRLSEHMEANFGYDEDED